MFRVVFDWDLAILDGVQDESINVTRASAEVAGGDVAEQRFSKSDRRRGIFEKFSTRELEVIERNYFVNSMALYCAFISFYN